MLAAWVKSRRWVGVVLAAAAFALALGAPTASAETFVVDSDEDHDGFCGEPEIEALQVEDDCTLREAIEAANFTSEGPDEIHFDFPDQEGETVTIRPQSPLPPITEAVTIDGTTHDGPESAKDIELDGSESGGVSVSQLGGSDGLVVSFDGGGTTIRGLAINNFPDNGILLLDDGNTIEGNYIGTNASGSAAAPNGRGINVESADNTIGGVDDSDRNVISGNEGEGMGEGILIEPPDIGDLGGEAEGQARTEGQRTGDEPDGDDDGGPGEDVDDPLPDDPPDEGDGSLPDPGEVISGEVISGNADGGSDVSHLIADTNLVIGNYIGTDAGGKGDLGNSGSGVAIDGADGTAIGADSAQDGNRIAFNGGDGVTVEGGGGNEITRNSIFSNDELGIDLGGDGQTPNDEGDTDEDGNDLQNFPLLLEANVDGGSMQVDGALPSTPDSTFRIEFFSDKSCEAGAAEGRDFLGSEEVVTDASGNAFFSATVAEPDPSQDGITATATNTSGDTSEFSNCVEVAGRGGSGGSDGGDGGGDGGGGDDDDQGTDGTTTTGGLIASSTVGNIYIKLPGETLYRLLKPGETIPLGAKINAIHGRVRLSVLGPSGETDTAEFFGGAFLVTSGGAVAAQAAGTPQLIELRLIGGDFSGCTPVRRLRSAGAPAAQQAVVRRVRRRVWGSGRGRFRTTGRYAAATVRGTVWRTDDRCDGTLIAVRSGVVSVYDRVLKRTVLVRAGHAYLARAKRPS